MGDDTVETTTAAVCRQCGGVVFGGDHPKVLGVAAALCEYHGHDVHIGEVPADVT